MPYEVIEMSEPGADITDLLNQMEQAGWTLSHVIPGFSSAGESIGGGKRQRVFWMPRLVFHKGGVPGTPGEVGGPPRIY